MGQFGPHGTYHVAIRWSFPTTRTKKRSSPADGTMLKKKSTISALTLQAREVGRSVRQPFMAGSFFHETGPKTRRLAGRLCIHFAVDTRVRCLHSRTDARFHCHQLLLVEHVIVSYLGRVGTIRTAV